MRMPLHALALLAAGSAPLPALAEEGDGGAGLYGQLDTDFVLALGAGGGAWVDRESGSEVLAEARLRYFATASLVLGWDARPTGDGLAHSAVAAVELRPLLLILFTENRFSGDPFSDVVLDGLGITGGVQADAEGMSLVVGIGTEWPLWRSRSSGLHLRTEVRGRFADASWQGSDADRTEAALLLALQWHVPLDLRVVR